jgi:THO complex subunit 2
MAAILIREGFISLDDLYPHLSPSDEDMEEKEYKAYLASVETRIAGAKVNRLAMAAPLESSSQSNSRESGTEAEKKQPEEKQLPSQKHQLLVALLGIGALRPALSILSKFRWLTDAHTEIADLLIRVMRHSLEGLYQVKCPPKMERSASYQQPRLRYTTAGLQPPPARKSILTLCAPVPPGTSTVDYVYFFPNWTDRIPLCSSFDDLQDVIEPIMAFAGLHISRDPLFLTKFLRLGRQHILPVCFPYFRNFFHLSHLLFSACSGSGYKKTD